MTECISAQNAANLQRAASALQAGLVVALPTESSWGLAVDALNQAALNRLFLLKDRPAGQPPPVGISGSTMLDALVPSVPDAARRLMEAWWPGALTLVLPARPGLPAAIVSEGYVGVRESPHSVVRALLAVHGRPITLTSANRSGAPPAMRREDLLEGIDLILDGETGGGLASTVVRVAADNSLTILRQGPIHL